MAFKRAGVGKRHWKINRAEEQVNKVADNFPWPNGLDIKEYLVNGEEYERIDGFKESKVVSGGWRRKKAHEKPL